MGTSADDCAATLTDGVLTIDCDLGGSVVEFTQTGDNAVSVTRNGVPVGDFAGVQRISIDLGAGDDTLRLTNAVTVPIHVDGGAGNDTLDLSGASQAATVIIGPDPGTASDFENVENIIGTNQNDVFVFNPGVDLSAGALDGLGGIDTLDFSRVGIAIQVDLSTNSAFGMTVDNFEQVFAPLFLDNLVISNDGSVLIGSLLSSDSTAAASDSLGDSTSDQDDSHRRNLTNGAGAEESQITTDSDDQSTDDADGPDDSSPGDGEPITLEADLVNAAMTT